MPNITFIIGNGLDIAFDLKTQYRDFYAYVELNQPHPKNRIYKAIQDSPESWGDFELALGQYTRYVDNLAEKDIKKESILLHEELEEIRDDLADYITNEVEKNLISDSSRIAVDGFYSGLVYGQKDKISTLMGQGMNQFDFITLNYTDTLERIIVNSQVSLNNYSIRRGPILHIHGDLTENMTLGVSEESQLSAIMSGAERDDLIKPSLIFSMNDGRIESMENMLQSSMIAVLFGTSIGETDKYIWERLVDWLKKNPGRYIIIHQHDDEYTENIPRSSRRQKQFTNRVKDNLLLHAGLDGDAMENLRDRIFVIFNSNKVFKIN